MRSKTVEHRSFWRQVIATALLVFAACGSAYSNDWVPPESTWIETKKSAAHRVLRRTNPQIIISPVQGGIDTFDPTEKSLITFLISDHVSRYTNLTVANPNLVVDSLGLHKLVYEDADLKELANVAGAGTLLAMSATHDRNGNFDLTLTLFDVASWSPVRSKTWSQLHYDDLAPPYLAVAEILDEIAALVSDNQAAKAQVASRQRFEAEEFLFPLSFDELKSESAKSDLLAAAYLQVIGMLHPHGTFNATRNQLFERSLVMLRHVSADDPYQRYFTARAYAYLGRRPAAVHALGRPKTAHERALLAALNGDLPGLRTEVEKMGTSALDFMSWRELIQLEALYDQEKEHETMEALLADNIVWAPFIYRALNDYDDWANYSTLTLKAGLEELLPADGVSLQSFYDSAAAMGDVPSDTDLMRLLFQHIESYSTEQMTTWSSDPAGHINATEIDLLNLARTAAVTNLIRRVNVDLDTRHLPESALKKIREVDAFFAGHPEVTLLAGKAFAALAEEATGSEKGNYQREALVARRNGISWTGPMTRNAADVSSRLGSYLRDYSRTSVKEAFPGIYAGGYRYRFTEWPQSMEWAFNTNDIKNGVHDRCIAYLWARFNCLELKIDVGMKLGEITPESRAEILAENSHRYIGHPQRDAFEIALARESDDADAEIVQLRARIAKGDADWGLYYALGRALKRNGDYKAAQEAWLSYPPFLDSRQRVSLGDDNNASNAGSLLYWIGQHELAIPLLEISAASTTGSGGSYSSRHRLSLIKGDLEGAEQWTSARVRRYRGKYGIRDLQQILHIRSRSDLAWAVFDQAIATTKDSQMWSGALVGHRMVAASIDDIKAWIVAADARKLAWLKDPESGAKIDLGQRYLFMAGTMDRAPGADLAEEIASLRIGRQPQLHPFRSQVGVENGEAVIETTMVVFGHNPNNPRDALVPTPSKDLLDEQGKKIGTRYEMLASGMTPFLNQNYNDAFTQLNETAYYYNLDEYLPYYAFSAAIIGRSGHIKDALKAREPVLEEIRRSEKMGSSKLGYRFDEDLTYGVLAAFEGNHVEAVQYLNKALNNRPYIQDRSIYPLYQVVDLADRLYERTGEIKYRDLALELSRRHTIVLPMYAWAYFVVAKYGESDSERISAIASGLALDPLSHRGSLLPKDLLEEGKKMLEKNGAPYLHRKEETEPLDT